jgi:hypothetical protein
MKKEYPKLPTSAFTLLGPVSVTQCELAENHGETNLLNRTIEIKEGQHLGLSWSVYWHEVCHLLLFDAGVKLTKAQEELVCDAMGTYFAAAIRGGFLKVTP